MAEPRNGGTENAVIGIPRFLDFQRSVNVPSFRVIGALKAMSSIVRQIKRVWIFDANAHGMMKMTANRRVMA